MRIQVIFGVHREADFTCRRCGGARHAEELCMFCAGRPIPLPQAYTYDAPDGIELWSTVHVPNQSSIFPKIATVVALTSDYTGEVKSALPVRSQPIPAAPNLRAGSL